MLKGVVAMVTGGTSGLGRATVERFVRQGAKVTICDIVRDDGEAMVKKLGGDNNVVFTKCDVTSEEDVMQALSMSKKSFGKLNVLVNCAGIGYACRVYHPTRKATHKMEEFEKVIKVNLFGTFNTIRLAAPLLFDNEPVDEEQSKERGVIINTASIAAFDGQMGQVAYAASKGGIASMTLPIARDLSTLGIRNVTIAPGLFDTPLMAALPEKARLSLEATIPFPKRLGQPDEFARLVQEVVLNKMLNGEVIRLDGALRMI